MIARALQLWQKYEQEWNLKLFFWSGALRMAGTDDSYESSALPVLREAGIPFEKLSAAEVSFPNRLRQGTGAWSKDFR